MENYGTRFTKQTLTDGKNHETSNAGKTNFEKYCSIRLISMDV